MPIYIIIYVCGMILNSYNFNYNIRPVNGDKYDYN